MVRAADGGTSAAASDRTGQTKSSGCPPAANRAPAANRSQARSYLHSAQDRTSAGAGMPGLHKGSLQGVLVPAPRTAQSTGPCPAELPGPYGDTTEKNRQHKPDAGGGPRDRAGGGRYQSRPEPTGYALSPLRVGGATTTAYNYRREPSPSCGSPPRSLVTQVGSTVRRAGGTGNRTRVLPPPPKWCLTTCGTRAANIVSIYRCSRLSVTSQNYHRASLFFGVSDLLRNVN